jgi:hypothetical protein
MPYFFLSAAGITIQPLAETFAFIARGSVSFTISTSTKRIE